MAAILASIRPALANPKTMAVWGLMMFGALAVVMRILGHTTWHLYRKAVVAN
jgi:uncharacterized membrane protein